MGCNCGKRADTKMQITWSDKSKGVTYADTAGEALSRIKDAGDPQATFRAVKA